MYEITYSHPKYTAIITLLSFRTPFEFLTKIKEDLYRNYTNGDFLLDEFAHNDSEEKRFLFFRIENGKITETAFRFVSVDEYTRNFCDRILKKNKKRLEDIGVDLDF